MKRLIFHVDVNSAFLSWEATKRVREGSLSLGDLPLGKWRYLTPDEVAQLK